MYDMLYNIYRVYKCNLFSLIQKMNHEQRCINSIEKTFVNENFGDRIYYLVAITGMKSKIFYFVNIEFLNKSQLLIVMYIFNKIHSFLGKFLCLLMDFLWYLLKPDHGSASSNQEIKSMKISGLQKSWFTQAFGCVIPEIVKTALTIPRGVTLSGRSLIIEKILILSNSMYSFCLFY